MVIARRSFVLVATIVIACFGSVAPASAGGDRGNHTGPVVLPPNSRPYGASYGDWNARWWQWLYQTDRLSSPVFDETAGTAASPVRVDCLAGQHGPVWYLGGTYLPTEFQDSPPVARSEVHRTCRIPAGVALFFPVLNSEIDNLACLGVSFSPLSAHQLKRYNDFNMDSIVSRTMAVVIDGVNIDGLRDSHTAYRSISPWFSYQLPEHNLGAVACPDGQDIPVAASPPPVDHHPGATAEGVFLMVAPLARGVHTIHVQGEILIEAGPPLPPPAAPIDFTQDINYTIAVG